MPFIDAATTRSLWLEIPALHSSDLLVNSFLQGFDRFVHSNVSTPRVHGKTQHRQSTQRTPTEVETLALLRKTPDALAGACGVLLLGHESGG
jgi:hypothetical protein